MGGGGESKMQGLKKACTMDTFQNNGFKESFFKNVLNQR
jgi:hypothetical protein